MSSCRRDLLFGIREMKHRMIKKAKIVYLESKSVSSVGKVEGSGGNWLTGQIIHQKELFFFIRPDEILPRNYPSDKDFFMRADALSKHILTSQAGDQVEFQLGARKPEKPEARCVRILNYQRRRTTDLLDYILRIL
jgi:hypothetical protein